LEENTYTYEYVSHRGLTRKSLEFYDIKTKIDQHGKPVSDGFFYPDGGIKVRNLDTKEFYWQKAPGVESVPADLFGRNRFDPGGHKWVIITEGEYDAASLFQVTGVPTVSVRSSSSAVADCSSARSFLNAHDRVLLAFDGDSPGTKAREDVARLFDPNKVYVLEFVRHKDANEYLQAGEEDELRNIFHNAQRYLPKTIVAVTNRMVKRVLSEAPSVGVPFPFPTLNSMTYGMRRGESILLTAPPGVGKTELMHALEYQLLKETNDNVGAIFLEEPKGQHLRSLASIELGRPAFVPDHGVSDDDVAAAIQAAVKDDSRLFIYDHFGSSDPDLLIDSIRFLVAACDVGWVLLDHISLVVSGERSEKDERRALDYISTRLEMLVKELNFGLIFVSHINDAGQTRGSRAMEQLCDVRIELSRDTKGGSNIVDLLVSKNRPPMGKSGPAGSLRFDSFRRRFIEVSSPEPEGEQPWPTSPSPVPNTEPVSSKVPQT
jgi:twinkle protein